MEELLRQDRPDQRLHQAGARGSAGFEGPSLLLGGGIGSLLGQRLRLGHDDLRIFLLNGAAARAMEFPQYVRPGDTLADLLPILMHGDKDCVWVVEDEERMRLIGVVSQTDVMLKLLETIESEEPFPPEAEPT